MHLLHYYVSEVSCQQIHKTNQARQKAERKQRADSKLLDIFYSDYSVMKTEFLCNKKDLFKYVSTAPSTQES